MNQVKNIILILLIFQISSCSSYKNEKTSTAENHKFKYDMDFVNLLKDGDTNNNNFKLQKFDKLKKLIIQLEKENGNVISDYYLKKPDNNILLSNYIIAKLKWNMFELVEGKTTKEKIIDDILSKLPKENELLAFYYDTLFQNIILNQNEIKPSAKDIDFKKLGLNENDCAILFLSAMRQLGDQISRYSSYNYPNYCDKAKMFYAIIPTFNGKPYYEFIVPDFKDFEIEFDKKFPKVSFKNYAIPKFENAKKDFMLCINNK